MRIASKKNRSWKVLLLLVLGLLMACAERGTEVEMTAVPPPVTPSPPPTPDSQTARPDNSLVIATEAPMPPLTQFNEYGEVDGFNVYMMGAIARRAGFENYEFLVTPFQGVLESLANRSNDFDVVMSNLIVPETSPEKVAYTVPYLEVGQVMVVLADEDQLLSYQGIGPDVAVGVQRNSSSAETAQSIVGVEETNLLYYSKVKDVIQALIDEVVDVVIIDHYNAEHFARQYAEQIKIVGGEGREAWISSKGYGMAVPADRPELLQRLNEAITQVQSDDVFAQFTNRWLVTADDTIDAGESRVGTPENELIIGILGQLNSMDPTGEASLIDWEVKVNTMGGLYMVDSENELRPLLAEGSPDISEDKLEYTFRLRQGLRFSDGSEFTAEDVKWSLDRARLGSTGFLINGHLKDSNDDSFADEDAVQIIDPYTVRFVLQEPVPYFLSLLATPPFFPVSSECFPEWIEPSSQCGGIGPYQIVSWEPERMRLQANPQWPGQPPAFENIQLRFYGDDLAGLRRSLEEFRSIDIAWTGVPYETFVELQNEDIDEDGRNEFQTWEGPAVFKSYLIFEQSTPPWDSERVRQAVAYAIDRQALAREVFNGERHPLFSPVPDDVPGHVAVLPTRDLEQARMLLREEGYNEENPAEITLWYVSDGRYSPHEQQYAETLKQQLEATGIFQVTLNSTPWETYRVQIANCNYPAYLLGWPSPGTPVDYLDTTSWTDPFLPGELQPFCSNYESEEMAELLEAAAAEIDMDARMELYDQIQQLWAQELPTLDILQEPRRAISLTKVEGIRIDAMGFMRYQWLSKEMQE